ncbi:MAG: hypothetical protein HW416_3590 [Chloroflexi bacterium]|nr:hypothetical protein [Chloroflexota bacterium]
MQICLSPGGPSVFNTDEPASELLVATMDGLVALRRSDDRGAWDLTGRALEGRHVDALLHEPASGMLFVGTFGDSLHASEDGGATWERRDSGIDSDQIYSLNAVRVGDSVRVYAGTQPARLYVSEDLGAHWRELSSFPTVASVHDWDFPSPPHVAHLKGIAFDPHQPTTIYVGVEVGGLFRSLDSGDTWTEVLGFDEEWNGDYHRLSIRPNRPDELFLSSGPGMWRSRDGGRSWAHLSDRTERIGYPDGVIAHPDRDDLLFVAGAASNPGTWRKLGTADARVARSHDGGDSWEVLSSGLPDEIHGNLEAMCMNVYPGGFELFVGGIDGDVFSSVDEGDTWQQVATGLPSVSKGVVGRTRAGVIAGWK